MYEHGIISRVDYSVADPWTQPASLIVIVVTGCADTERPGGLLVKILILCEFLIWLEQTMKLCDQQPNVSTIGLVERQEKHLLPIDCCH